VTLQSEGKSPENEMQTLQEKIHLITKYQKPYIANSLKRMAQKGACNVKVICEYIIAEQNEINIKESTKEGKIKCLVRFSTYLNHKPFHTISRQDVLDYLTSLKKPISTDPQHKSVGTYNGRQMILLKFFRWLYNPNESSVVRGYFNNHYGARAVVNALEFKEMLGSVLSEKEKVALEHARNYFSETSSQLTLDKSFKQ